MLLSEKKNVFANRNRYEIIVDNIDKIIKEKEYSRKYVSELLGVSQATFSKKMKNMGSTFSVEELYEIAEILSVSVDEIYYTTKELVASSINKDKKFKAIPAQKIETIKLLEPMFSGYKSNIFNIILTVILYIGIIMFAAKYSTYWLFLSYSLPIIYFSSYKKSIKKTTFSINYLDDIYYLIKDTKFKNYRYYIVLHILQLLVSLIAFVILIFIVRNNILIIVPELFIICIISFNLLMIFNVLTLIHINYFKFKEKIYDNYIENYYLTLINVLINAVIFVVMFSLLLISTYKIFYLFLLALLMFSFSILEYIIVSKKYCEYHLIYHKYKGHVTKLYPNDYI